MGETLVSTSRTSHRIAVLAGLAAAVAIIVLAASSIRSANRRARSVANLEQIGAAM